MEKETIKELIRWLQSRVKLTEGENGITTIFSEAGAHDFRAHGFGDDVIGLTLKEDWWPEMVTDIAETPDFAEPKESPEQVLQYARDVVSEYIRKRLRA